MRSGELRRSGVRVSLQEQPFRILARLLATPGELVTRDELRRELWPDDTFVDFEHGLNVAIKRLRDALGESADTPRFIETLPRRGYRFVAPVQGVPRETSRAIGVRERRRAVTWAFTALAVLAVGGAAAWHSVGGRAAPPVGAVVLADIANQTADPVLTGTIREALAVKLDESHVVNLLPDERIHDALKMMRRAPGEPLTMALAREVCLREGAKATVGGTVTGLGAAYVISITAADCQTGKTLVRDQTQAWRKEDILPMVDAMTTRLRRRLGESLASIETANTPIAHATTSSFDALFAFTEGERRLYAGAQRDAISFYKRAIELDPEFAMAWAKLAVVQANLLIPGASDSFKKAYELRDRLTKREQFYVTAHYTRLFQGDVEGSRPMYELFKASYPEDPTPYNSLGLVSMRQGQYERAVAEFEGAVRVSPTPFFFSNLFSSYLAVGRIDDAQRLLSRWEASKGPIPYARFLLAFQRRDRAAVDVHGAAIDPGADGIIPAAERARAAAFFGQLARARTFFASAVSQTQADRPAQSAQVALEGAEWEAEVGNCARARQVTDAVLKVRRGPTVGAMAVAALATCDVQAMDKTAELVDLSVVRQQVDLAKAILDARRAIAHGRFADAIDRLKPFQASPLAGPPFDGVFSQVHGLAAAWLRGRAYLALGEPRDAEPEFRVIVDHPGVSAFAPYHALAPLYLGRALALERDYPRSRRAYDDFFSLWNAADRDIPIFVAARSEYARLPR